LNEESQLRRDERKIPHAAERRSRSQYEENTEILPRELSPKRTLRSVRMTTKLQAPEVRSQ